MTAERIRLVVLHGGRSAEHEVSNVSAVHVLRALDPGRYHVVPVGITHDGRWVVRPELAAGVRPNELPPALSATGDEVALPDVTSSTPGETTVVFPVLHGPFGEDGTMQGLLEQLGVPYVGSGVLGSAVAMDKCVAKDVLAAHRIPQVRYVNLRDDEVDAGVVDRVGRELGWPVFVKPANLGSSVGVTKVDGPADLRAAVDHALEYDEWIVVEEGVTGREIEVAVLGNRDAEASVPGEIVPGNDFYDYEDKYVEDGAKLLVPAPLDEEQSATVRGLAVRVYRLLRCEGMARVDFFLEEHGNARGLLVNEVNTLPGFTPISMDPKLWQASGVGYPELIDRLVALAVERHRRRAGRVGRARGERPGR
jgi:D-alanine-D-alanine ligase